jgi:hypothetical protein
VPEPSEIAIRTTASAAEGSPFHVFLEGWASGRLPDMRRAIELLREQSVLWLDGLLKIVFAETETGQGDPERGIALLDEALATADGVGYRAFSAELHRVRGDILLKSDRANTPPAEEAFHSAIAAAREQGTRSFELRAALPLAKLYHSPAARLTLTPSSRPRSKASPRHRSCQRSPRRRRCWSVWRRAGSGGAEAIPRNAECPVSSRFRLFPARPL